MRGGEISMRKISIIFVLVFWTALVFAQAPNITSAVFDEYTNVLRVEFDSPIWTSSDMFSIGGITLDDDNGGDNPDVTLNGGVILNTNVSDTYIEIRLFFEGHNSDYVDENDDSLATWGIDYSSLESIESFENKDNIYMLVREMTYLGTDNEPNTEKTLADSILVDYDYSGDAPEIICAEYDAATNRLILEFDRLVQWDSIEEDLMFFWTDTLGVEHHDPGNGILDVGEDRNDNGVLDFEQNVILKNITITDGAGSVTLDGGSVINTSDAEILEIDLLLDNYKAVENLDTDNLEISFPAYTFVDQDYNAVVGEVGYTLTFTEDADPLVADSARYDIAKNELIVYFNNALSTNYIQVPKFSFEIEECFITLEAASKPPTVNASGYVKITLLTTDQMIVEDAINSNPGSPVYLTIETYAVLDDLGNGNLFSFDVPVEIDNLEDSKAPIIEYASYYAETNILEVKFDLAIKQNTEDVNIQGFSLLNGSDTISFTSDELSESGDSKLLWIALNPSDELAVESVTDKENLLLLVEPFSVLQTPKLNGNWAVTADSSKIITYIVDTTPPLPDYVKYNNSIEKFVLHFSDAMTTEVDYSLITFAGLTFTGGEVEYGDDPGWLLLGLTAADIAAIDGLSNEDKVAVAVTFEDNAFISADSLGNMDLPELFVDGDTLMSGEESAVALVGIGRNFWLMSKEAFPTLDREIPATIRKIGEYCVVYVADDQWRPYYDVDMFGDIITTNYGAVPIIPSEVEVVWDHFEGSGEGYYQVNSIFADGKEELVPETVNMLLCDIRDEYNLGRNDTKEGYYIASFFNPNDQKSVWETGGEFNTNELDLIYIDSWPQLFSQTDSSNYLYDEGGSNEEWRDRKTPGFPVTVFHSIDNAYAKLLCYKVDPWESQWMIEGFASFAEWVIEGEVSFYGAGDPTTPTANSLKNFSTGLKTRTDFYNSYLFMLYLYEKYGEMDLVKMLAVQPTVDMEAINISFQKLLDEGAGTPELQELWANHTAKDVFGNYAMACLMDTTNMNFVGVNPYITGDDRMFQFDNADLYGKVSGKNAVIFKWDPEKGPPPYNISQEDWSFGYYYHYYNSPTSNPMLADTSTIKILLPFTEMNMYQVLLKNDPVLEFNNPNYYFKYFPYDTITHQTSFNVNPNDGWTPGIEPDDYRTCVIVGVLGGYGKITETCEEISLAQLSVAQSTIVPNRFDVYLLVSDLIWGDGSSGGDVPQVIYQYGDITTSLLMQPYEFLEPFGYEEDFSLYASYLNFDSPGTYSIQAFFVDLSGEEYYIGPYSFVVENYNPGAGLVFGIDGADFVIEANSYPQSFSVSLRVIESNAAPDEQNQYLFSNSYFAAPPAIEREAIGPAYHIQPEIYLDEPAWVSLPYADYIGAHSPGELGVYLYRNDSWVYIGGEPDPSTQTISVRAKQLGLMQLQTGPHNAIPTDLLVPDNYALKQNYPNPFNPTTRIDYQLAYAGNTTLKIYDILGREVATLVDRFQHTGFHSLVWDGRSNSGIPAASGVYLYRLESGKFNKACKMILLK